MFNMAWQDLITCFTPRVVDEHEFRFSTFDISLLQYRLDSRFREGVVKVPQDLYTTGYADMTERIRYGRIVAAKLVTLGVTVLDIPPRDPIREKYYHGRIRHGY